MQAVERAKRIARNPLQAAENLAQLQEITPAVITVPSLMTIDVAGPSAHAFVLPFLGAVSELPVVRSGGRLQVHVPRLREVPLDGSTSRGDGAEPELCQNSKLLASLGVARRRKQPP